MHKKLQSPSRANSQFFYKLKIKYSCFIKKYNQSPFPDQLPGFTDLEAMGHQGFK